MDEIRTIFVWYFYNTPLSFTFFSKKHFLVLMKFHFVSDCKLMKSFTIHETCSCLSLTEVSQQVFAKTYFEFPVRGPII